MRDAASEKDPKETANERKRREHQETIDKLARANRLVLIEHAFVYRFERIGGDPDEQKEQEKKGGISSGLAVETYVKDKPGVYRVYEKDSDKLVPDILLYVDDKGRVTSSVKGAYFTQKHADAIVEKAIEAMQARERDPVTGEGYERNLVLQVGEKDTDWRQKPPGAIRISMRNLDKMIKAAHKRGEPYTLGASAKNLIAVYATGVTASGMRLTDKDRAHYAQKAARYLELESQQMASNNPLRVTRDLLVGAARDGGLRKNKEVIESITKSPDDIATETAKLSSVGEKLDFISRRLSELTQRSEAAEAAAKEIKTSVDGAEALLDAYTTEGSKLFQNPYLPDDIKNQEKGLHKAEALLANLNERFEAASANHSPRVQLHSVVESESQKIRGQIATCRAELQNMLSPPPAGASPLSAGEKERIQKIEKQLDSLERRLADTDKSIADAAQKAQNTVPGKLKKADQVFSDDKDRFEAEAKRPLSPR